ncbi:alpha/beta fold hydrolase [Mycobacterium spongiae]|uniref:Alpha/beta fold hydrolase n=1 Tax=Mycobacterium spongiae TaxID=886343 RepID=A0A975K086_9MYCO|nr:alpha/beta fold hydrolase [Mycobacterium spongiae]QUR67808.1 alpha/beta fold hydrolase [Mycobacterium spongiae]
MTLAPIDRPAWLPASAWPWPTTGLMVGPDRVAITDIGQGHTLLFVHVGTWSFVWRDVLAHLHTRFRCVAIDPVGSGLSDRIDRRPTLDQAAATITSVIDALDLRDVTLVAHDLGGPAAFAAASRRPDRIASLAAVNCFAWRPTGVLFRGMLSVMGSAPARESDALLAWLPAMTSTRLGVGRHWKRTDRKIFRAGLDTSARRAWHAYFRDARRAEDLYREIHTGLTGPLAGKPLLSVFGEHNDPLGFQPQWKALFPDARQLKVLSGNHFPMCDDPQFVGSALGALTAA